MRIMHVITGLNTGGAEMMLLKLLSATTRPSEHVVVSLTDEGTIGPRISQLDVPVHSLGLARPIPNPVRILSIGSLTRRLRPQLIQGWMPHGNLMASLAGMFARGRVPVLWNIRMSLHDHSAETLLSSPSIRLGAFLSSRPRAIIYNSQTGAKHHEAMGYNAKKCVVIPNGFDCEMFRPDDAARRQIRAELGLAQETVLVGLIARFDPMKDHGNFFRAAAVVSQAHPEVRFLLAGWGMSQDQPEIAKLLQEHQLQSRTFLLGERSDMPRLTASLDLACSASWAEGFSNTIGEAMACGVPCVVTDVGDSRHIVADTGLAVPARDHEALARAMLSLIDAGPARRQELGTAARRRVEQEFSLPAIVRRYEDLYREHLGGPQLAST